MSEARDGLEVDQSILFAAHELKSPLTLIRQLSLELEEGKLSPTQRCVIERQIRLVSEKSLRLTTNLTKSASIQTRLFPTESLQVGPILDEVQHELSPLYAAYNRTLLLRKASVQPVVANHDLLHRVLANFVDNALYYSNEDQVVELFASTMRHSGIVRIGVRDRGPRLPTHVWKSLQISASGSMPSIRSHSSGLGIKIAYAFATNMGGTIGAIRHRSGGTSFYVDLPLSRQLSLL